MSSGDRFLTSAYLKSPLYRLALRGKTPTTLRASPSEAWPGLPERGRAMTNGAYSFFGKTVALGNDPWQAAEQLDLDPAWLGELHGFNWLRDLSALGGDAARKAARDMVAGWLARYEHYDETAWATAVTARRIANWIVLFDFVCGSAEDSLEQDVLAALARQTRHVMGRLVDLEDWSDRLQAARGLCAAAAAFGDELTDAPDWLEEAIAIVDEAAAILVLDDGGHVSRSPSAHLRFLRDLLDIRAGLIACGAQVPSAAAQAIPRMAGVLRYLRHGDGRLALFHDSNEEDSPLIEAVLAQCGPRIKAPQDVPAMAYERMQSRRSLIIVDVGPIRSGPHGHASPLAFEFSVGRERMVVNCGAASGLAEIGPYLKQTSAHSTLNVMADAAPVAVEWSRTEAEGAILVEAHHDGFEAKSLTHSRSLYLSATGEDLRGEDRLIGTGARDFEIRFHLHPKVKAQVTQGGDQVLLRLGSAGGWRFEADSAMMSLEESLYFGDRDERHKSTQIVLTDRFEGSEKRVRWALRRG